MKRNIFLFFLTFCVLHGASAQIDSVFTLPECIEYAFNKNVDVLNAKLDQDIAQSKVGEIRSIGYPQINGEISLIDNPRLQRMFFASDNPFMAGGGGGFEGAEQQGDVVSVPNFFQLRSGGDAKITATQLIFDGSYLVGLQAASTYKELAMKNTTMTKIQVVENVTKAYYLVLVNEERSKLFDNGVARMDSMIRDFKIMQENGLIEEIEVSRLVVARNNLESARKNFVNLKAISEDLLKFQMGLPLDHPITLEDHLSALELNPEELNKTSFAPEQRIEYSILKTSERLQELQLKNVRFSRLPSLAAFATGGINKQDNRFADLFAYQWFSYGMIGVSLKVPILGLQSQYQAQQSKYEIQKLRNTISNAQSGFALQANTAKNNLSNSFSEMENQKKNMELAQEVTRVSRIKYKEGVGSNLEVVTAESELKDAQINYYQALYDAVIAKIEYQKATGTLYNGQ